MTQIPRRLRAIRLARLRNQLIPIDDNSRLRRGGTGLDRVKGGNRRPVLQPAGANPPFARLAPCVRDLPGKQEKSPTESPLVAKPLPARQAGVHLSAGGTAGRQFCFTPAAMTAVPAPLAPPLGARLVRPHLRQFADRASGAPLCLVACPGPAGLMIDPVFDDALPLPGHSSKKWAGALPTS